MEYDRTQSDLREQLLREARDAVGSLAGDGDVLAAILTGSAAWGKPNPDGDIDILVIARGRRGVCYRYLVPKFCRVKRRTELGFIPIETVRQKIGEGYATLISCSLLEQLKNGYVLFQKGTEGDDLVASCRKARPGLMTVGTLITELGRAVRSMERRLDAGEHEGVILGARRAAQLSARTLLLARETVGVSKEKHEYRAVRRHLVEREAREYEELMEISSVAEEDARLTMARSVSLMKWVLERFSLSANLVDYERKRKTPGAAA
jgi:hypothetical protein